MNKFRKAFVPNPAVRFDADKIRDLANELIYVCDTSIFDDMAGDENKYRFEGRVKEVMINFDHKQDVIVFFGDALILSMMIISIVMEPGESVFLARYSTKTDQYLIRELKFDEIVPWEMVE